MLNKYIDSVQDLDNSLQYWKNYTFSDSYVKLDNAVESFSTDRPLVEGRQDYPGRWVLCKSDTKGRREAIFHTAAVWRWNSDLDTGNFLFMSCHLDRSIHPPHSQRTPNNLCQLSYAVDTMRDKSIWTAQQAFEKHMEAHPAFNMTGKDRRAWQNGESSTATYVLSAQVFMKRTKFTARMEEKIPYPIHDWIVKGTEKTAWFANPDKPRIFEPQAGKLRDIKEANPPYLKTGDLVWMSFYAEFIIGLNYWSTTFTPVEIIRVGTVAPHLVGDGYKAVDEVVPRQALSVGDVICLSKSSAIL
ncbi:hypothetical protein OH77DRAFT_1465381 [Trametes cingulata]|nr:hypothetical protein OH77DRAFT_1465381 [Trametes cingulata]